MTTRHCVSTPDHGQEPVHTTFFFFFFPWGMVTRIASLHIKANSEALNHFLISLYLRRLDCLLKIDMKKRLLNFGLCTSLEEVQTKREKNRQQGQQISISNIALSTFKQIHKGSSKNKWLIKLNQIK